MSTVLVWILILSSFQGGMLKVENIATFEDCERLRLRAEHASFVGTSKSERWKTVSGSCTQVPIMQPAAPVINVPPTTAPIIKNTVIIRKNP
jgi:hypothetical protein